MIYMHKTHIHNIKTLMKVNKHKWYPTVATSVEYHDFSTGLRSAPTSVGYHDFSTGLRSAPTSVGYHQVERHVYSWTVVLVS
jgi:nicotinamidase-related amidase